MHLEAKLFSPAPYLTGHYPMTVHATGLFRAENDRAVCVVLYT